MGIDPYPNFNGDLTKPACLTKPPANLRHGWSITSHIYRDVIHYAPVSVVLHVSGNDCVNSMFRHPIHWNGNIVILTVFSSPSATEVIILTTSWAASDENLVTWWRHQIQTFSALLALCEGNPPVTSGFPSQRPMTRSFDVFFDVRLNKRLGKQWSCRWLEVPWHSL